MLTLGHRAVEVKEVLCMLVRCDPCLRSVDQGNSKVAGLGTLGFLFALHGGGLVCIFLETDRPLFPRAEVHMKS